MSSLAVISDLHITDPFDSGALALKSFFSHPLVCQEQTQTIIFLGDIFDFMCGFKLEYLDKYSFFFNYLAESLKAGKKIYYVEGNHDFQLRELFFFFYQKYVLSSPASVNSIGTKSNRLVRGQDLGSLIVEPDRFIYTTRSGQRIYFSHGDDFPAKDYLYKLTRSFFRSPVARFLIDKLSYQNLERIGFGLSRRSRAAHGLRNQAKIEKIKTDFRKSAMEKGQKYNCDYVVAGHVHIEDFYEGMIQRSEIGETVNSREQANSWKKCVYLNNGLPGEGHQFIYLHEADEIQEEHQVPHSSRTAAIEARLVSLDLAKIETP